MTDPYLNRRKVLGGLAAGAGAAWFADGLATSTAAAATAGGPVAGRSGHYVPNRAPLAAVPFQKLPPGAVCPRGWLAQQLVLQVNGLCGRYDDVSEYLIPMGAARLRITSFPTTPPRSGGHRWDLRPIASASHVWDGDSYEALSDDRVPASSADISIPRFTWWDRRGSIEWVQLDLREPRAVSEASAYWFDDTGFGQCRVPASWRVLWLDGSTWRPVTGADAYPTDLDRFNTVRFDRVRAQVFRVEVQLRPDVSGGILELRFK